jgi:hypothetical protein
VLRVKGEESAHLSHLSNPSPFTLNTSLFFLHPPPQAWGNPQNPERKWAGIQKNSKSKIAEEKIKFRPDLSGLLNFDILLCSVEIVYLPFVIPAKAGIQA